MSHAYFNAMWAEAQKDLRKALTNEKALGQGQDIPFSDRINFFGQTAKLYYSWIGMYKKFDEVYDQIVHPQKLPLIRKLLDIVIARLIELRNVMVGTELSEVLYFDDVMHFYSWMPSELDVPIPKYYTFHDGGRKERENLLLSILQVKKDQAEAQGILDEEKKAHEKIVSDFRRKIKAYELAAEAMLPHEAILLIQLYERYRQGRERMAMAKLVDMEEAQRRRRKFKEKQVSSLSPDKAATIIQKIVRGFLARRKVKKIREKEMSYLGLLWKPQSEGDEKDVALASIKKMEDEIAKNAEKRRRVQRRYQKNFEEAEALIESRLRLLEAPEMAERMKWQLRTWMLHIKEKEGKLPELPKFGGSLNLFCPERLSDEVKAEIAEEKEKEKKKKDKKNKKKKEKEKKKDKKKDEKEEKPKKKAKKNEIVPTKFEPMVFLDEAIDLNREYNVNWRHKDESNNPDQKHEDDPIIVAKRKLVGQETRNKVDVLMKGELKQLKKVLENKKGKKKKKKKKKDATESKAAVKPKRTRIKLTKAEKKKRKKDKKKKKKGGGGKKKKKFKDITPDHTWESLFEELVGQGIIINYPRVRFDDLIGDYSLVNETIRKYFAENPTTSFHEDTQFKMPFNANPPPTYGDIKRAVRDICVLPLGSPTVHEMVNFTKSLLIAGAPRSGKKSLVHAVCTEMGATLFDLTASNIAGKYPGKTGLTMLIHLINKVARICQPSIILIEQAEKVFAKKVGKTDKTDPKRLKKQLKKFLKIIGPDDQMMLIGLSSEPWLAPMKPMKKTFEKMLFIPKADHAARLAMWQKCLGGSVSDFHPEMHLSLLSKLSDNWTLGQIKEVAERVTGEHKRIAAKEKEDHEKPFEFDISRVLEGSLLFKTVKIGRKLIRMEELTNEISHFDPIFVEQEKAWNSWWNKTPLQKLRIASQYGGGKKKKKGKGKDKGKRR